MGFIRSSIFTRDWAWRAFEALALNLSTKLWMWARWASCLRFMDSCCSSFIRRSVSNWS